MISPMSDWGKIVSIFFIMYGRKIAHSFIDHSTLLVSIIIIIHSKVIPQDPTVYTQKKTDDLSE